MKRPNVTLPHVQTPNPATLVNPPLGFRFAQFRTAVPFMAVNGTTDGAITARVGEPIVRDAARVAEIVETTEAGGCLAFSLEPDARTGVVQVRLVPYSNVICVVRV
jgi:hypothetical protein